jgi:hypothetical protein
MITSEKQFQSLKDIFVHYISNNLVLMLPASSTLWSHDENVN